MDDHDETEDEVGDDDEDVGERQVVADVDEDSAQREACAHVRSVEHHRLLHPALRRAT